MASTGSRVAEGSPPDVVTPPFDLIKYNAASSTRALTGGLAGTCIAILTFVLFFLYPRWTSGAINGLLFQWTLLNIVVTTFLMCMAAMLYWMVMEAMVAHHPLMPGLSRRADDLFLVSTVLLLLEPALILFTVGVDYVAGAALGLWFVVLLILWLARRWFY